MLANLFLKRVGWHRGRESNPRDCHQSQNFSSFACISLSTVNTIFSNYLDFLLFWVSLDFIGYCWVPAGKARESVYQISYEAFWPQEVR
jgi:hypothetical protein